MTERKGWLDKFLKPDPDRADRRPVRDFAAYRWAGSALKQEAAKNVSSSGVYLLTDVRWQPGTVLTLTLQREGPVELSTKHRITTQARVVRCGHDGVGLSFVLAENPESVRWDGLLEGMIGQMKPENMLTLVRIVAAVAFLRRICPGGGKQIEQLFRERLSNYRITKAIDIALAAEELLASDPHAECMRVQPRVAVRILEAGTTTDGGWLHRYWSGLLVTYCSVNARDKSDLNFLELFCGLTSNPLRILTVACTRAAKVISETGEVSARPLAYKLEELVTTTGLSGLHMERDLEVLSKLGLIEKGKSDGQTPFPSDEIRVTPTSLGLQLFARCNGQRGSLREFYTLDSSGTLGRANQ
jgi:hypothetical protein